MAAPMPFDAPVTSATFPFRLLMIRSFASTCHYFDISITVELIREPSNWIQNDCGKFSGAGVLFKSGQPGGERLQYAGAQAEEVELAFAADFNQSSRLQLLDVVGERGGRDGQRGAGLGTGERAVGRGDFLEQLEARRIGKRFEDRSAASAGEAGRPGC